MAIPRTDPVPAALPVLEGACCAECAAGLSASVSGPAGSEDPPVGPPTITPRATRSTSAVPGPTLMPVGLSSVPRGREMLTRRTMDRRLTALAIAIAAAYVATALLSLLAPAGWRMGWWLPLHLLLAGGAATAISGVMPFFSAGVASVDPARTSIRVLGIGGIAVGAGLIVLVRLLDGGAIDNGILGALAGGVYLAGVVGVAASTLLPLRAAIGPRRVSLALGYGIAMTCITIGALVGTLGIAGWRPVLDAWDVLKPVHAWLNVFGFLSLVIGASLLHLLPTVAGTRIERGPTSMTVLITLGIGPIVTALGFALRATPLAVLGAIVLVVGALALVVHAVVVMRQRGHWTTDPAWHRFIQGSLLAATGWFVVGVVLAMWQLLIGGATAAGWRTDVVLAPIALGWAVQALVGSWSHLLPSIGPGGPPEHARQRAILGELAVPRLVATQGGVALATLGLCLDVGPAVIGGVVLVGGSVLCSVGLLARAFAVLRGQGSRPKEAPGAA